MKQTFYARVTSKGQITMPKAVRETLSIYPGDKVAFTVEDGTVGVRGINLSLDDIIGSIKPVHGTDGSDWDLIRQEAWDEAARERVQRMNEQ